MKHLVLILSLNGHVMTEPVPAGEFASAQACTAYVQHELTLISLGGIPVYGRAVCKSLP